MKDIYVIQKLIDDKTIETTLYKGSTIARPVKALQNVLHELGFEKELKWQKYGADGKYGTCTGNAVISFGSKNGIRCDGEAVNAVIGQRIVELQYVTEDLRLFIKIEKENKTDAFIYRDSPHPSGTKALQALLNFLGYGEQLKWEKYGADGDYGQCTANAVKAFASANNLDSDGEKVTPVVARKLIAVMKQFYGASITNGNNTSMPSGKLKINETGKRVSISDGLVQKQFGKYKKGVFTIGDQKTADFIEANKTDLLARGMSESALNIMISVSENEGNLDAVNTWDNSFMTFGMFQWTVGVRADPGELPALLKKIKVADKEVFRKYYGQYGLTLVDVDSESGFLKLKGTVLASGNDKKLLRTYAWAFRFWKSGQDPLVQSVELEHAFSRIGRFYKSKNYMVDGHYISDLISSEYGVALLLDNHVNRPAYIVGCLRNALRNTGLKKPESWTDGEEQKLIAEYLNVRENFGKYPMTDAAKRAEVTGKYLNNGIISNKRGSFVFP